jgi:hypothetical protein
MEDLEFYWQDYTLLEVTKTCQLGSDNRELDGDNE